VSPSSDLLAIIEAEIRDDGPISFARYMELALYHPEFGYYRGPDRFGVAGDFYTAEQLQPVFGETVAAFTEGLAGDREDYRILELGAGRSDMKDHLSRWSYQAFDWNTPGLPTPFSGLVFANEFFDALPVHLLARTAIGWSELLVTSTDGHLTLEPAPASEVMLNYAERYGTLIPEGGRLEVPLAYVGWMRRIAKRLRSGHLLIIDYGYEARELLRFPSGSLLAYRNHRSLNPNLSEAGKQDLTAHVNFDWLKRCAEMSGFLSENLWGMSEWFFSVWNEQRLETRWKDADGRWRLLWKQLAFGMGPTFEVALFKRRAPRIELFGG
jgi:SAM-dependent MidA family methyltransferase